MSGVDRMVTIRVMQENGKFETFLVLDRKSYLFQYIRKTLIESGIEYRLIADES